MGAETQGGAFAVYLKAHHSMMDGVAGTATLGVTYDFARGAEHEGLPQSAVSARENHSPRRASSSHCA